MKSFSSLSPSVGKQRVLISWLAWVPGRVQGANLGVLEGSRCLKGALGGCKRFLDVLDFVIVVLNVQEVILDVKVLP